MKTPDVISKNPNNPLHFWLNLNIFLIFSMVLVGGFTRLTGSGLSMVHWEPIKAFLPPLNEGEWARVFMAYKASPEYLKINTGMNITEFKSIFYWEYFHRLLGRLIGLIYLLPLLFFHFKGYLNTKNLKLKLYLGFLLGGTQGLLGWYMVKSGLIDNPHVSHYRLAAHLMLAFFVAGYLYWVSLQLRQNTSKQKKRFISPFSMKKSLSLLSFLIVLQFVYGAFTAGLKAGLEFNTFPHMNGELFPFQWLDQTPFIMNFLELNLGVQWLHRTLAWLILIISFYIGYRVKRSKLIPVNIRKSYQLYLYALSIQFVLGVLTLLSQLNIYLASMHQLGAFLLMLSMISIWFHVFQWNQEGFSKTNKI